MSLPEVTYTYYKGYGGGLSEADFGAALPHARAAVRDLIGFNEPGDDDQTAAYENAVCAACDVDFAYGLSGGVQEGVTSASIGSFNYGTGSNGASAETSYDSDINRAIRRELVGSGLLCQVIL